MDYRLDLFNAVKNYCENSQGDDSLLIVCHNPKDGDVLYLSHGDVTYLSAAISNAEDKYINFETEEQKKAYQQTQFCILNMAANILRENKELKTKFEIAMQTF